jgi:hypothetical protein
LTVFTHSISEPFGGPSPTSFVPGGQVGAALQAASAAANINNAIADFTEVEVFTSRKIRGPSATHRMTQE